MCVLHSFESIHYLGRNFLCLISHGQANFLVGQILWDIKSNMFCWLFRWVVGSSIGFSLSMCVLCVLQASHLLCLMCETSASFSIFMWLKMKMSEHGCAFNLAHSIRHNFVWFLHIKWIIVVFNFAKSLTLFSGYTLRLRHRRDWIEKSHLYLSIYRVSVCASVSVCVCCFFFWNIAAPNRNQFMNFLL